MEGVFLKINGIEYSDCTKIGEKSYKLMPSKVIPGTDIVKSVERSLNGTAIVDITAVKYNIQVVYDLLDNESFECLLDLLKVRNTAQIVSEGIVIEYFDFRDMAAKKELTCYLDGIAYVPFIHEDELFWQNVTLNFCEI